jgi:hypothetical protein
MVVTLKITLNALDKASSHKLNVFYFVVHVSNSCSCLVEHILPTIFLNHYNSTCLKTTVVSIRRMQDPSTS